jgi:uncharacterized protein YlaI
VRNNKQYREYLQSKEWRERSNECKLLAGNQCKLCGSKESLQAHHLTYKNVYNEPQEDLLCVCADCHHKIHPDMEQKNAKKGWCSMYKKDMKEALRSLKKHPTAFELWLEIWDLMKKDGTIKMPIQQKFADKLGTKRQVIGRALKKLQDEKIIAKHDGEWLYNPFLFTVAGMSDQEKFEAQQKWEEQIGYYVFEK